MSTIRANTITDTAGTGAPTFSNGIKTNAILDASGGNTATINGIVPIAIGDVPASMTLLGTLVTTSGTTVTLSGLNLTSYKQLMAVFKQVSPTANASVRLSTTGGPQVSQICGAGNQVDGIFITDLGSGILVMNSYIGNIVTENNNSLVSNPYAGIQNTVTTASTSITFALSAGAFDFGSITIYGVK